MEIYEVNKGVIWIVILAFMVYLLTFAVKAPIKLLTKKIEDKHKRALVNKVILAIPLALGVIAEYLYDMVLKQPFNYNAGLTIGVSAISIYATFERVFKSKSKTEYDTGAGKEILEVAKKKANKEDIEAVDELIKKLEDI